LQQRISAKINPDQSASANGLFDTKLVGQLRNLLASNPAYSQIFADEANDPKKILAELLKMDNTQLNDLYRAVESSQFVVLQTKIDKSKRVSGHVDNGKSWLKDLDLLVPTKADFNGEQAGQLTIKDKLHQAHSYFLRRKLEILSVSNRFVLDKEKQMRVLLMTYIDFLTKTWACNKQATMKLGGEQSGIGSTSEIGPDLYVMNLLIELFPSQITGNLWNVYKREGILELAAKLNDGIGKSPIFINQPQPDQQGWINMAFSDSKRKIMDIDLKRIMEANPGIYVLWLPTEKNQERQTFAVAFPDLNTGQYIVSMAEYPKISRRPLLPEDLVKGCMGVRVDEKTILHRMVCYNYHANPEEQAERMLAYKLRVNRNLDSAEKVE